MSEQPGNRQTESALLVQVLIVAALGLALGRVMAAERLYEPSVHYKRSEASAPPPRWPATPPKPMPTFSSNDRSRWATVRSLVEQGTFVVGRRDKLLTERSAVALLAGGGPLEAAGLYAAGVTERIRSDQGIIFEDGWQSVDKVLHPRDLEYYSSKPPLLTTLMAGAYYPLYHGLGWSLEREPFLVVRSLVVLFNLVPLALYLWLLYRIADRYAAQRWTTVFVVAAGAFGTLLNPFLISISNHVPAVYCTLFLLYVLLRVDRLGPSASLGWYLLAGLLGGILTVNELPALSFTALSFLLLARVSLSRTLLGYVPLALLPIVAMVALNWLAVGQITPIYSETGSIWYQYEGSHWLQIPNDTNPKRGIDFAFRKETRLDYAFHLLVGHHGFFSLTPLFLLGLVGLVMGFRERPGGQQTEGWPRWLGPSVLLVSAVVVGFYLIRSNNYGGWSNGPRWLLWLTPLWLVGMIPVVDRLAGLRWGRGLALVLLLLSALSAGYFDWNPWRHPWIYNWMDSAGRIPY